MGEKPNQSQTLYGVLNDIWKMLERGATRFNDPFHWPVLGTSGSGGVSLRCVILREFFLPDRLLVCHTDARARKVREISNFSKISWLFYHPKKKVQLRITGCATLHIGDEYAARQWAVTKTTSRLNYCAPDPPGTPVDNPSSGLPDFLLNKVPTLLETKQGQQNFAAISCRIDSIDWLVLRVLGNLRARFEWGETGLKAEWLIP